MDSLVMRHLPALLIATPLLAAFLMPILGSAGPKIRNAWVLFGALATAAVGFALACKVFSGGTVLYVFGAAAPHAVIPMDSGGIPVRIVFQIDALGALMVALSSLSALAVVA